MPSTTIATVVSSVNNLAFRSVDLVLAQKNATYPSVEVATINIQIIRTAVTNSGIVAIWMNLKMDEPKERSPCRQAGRNNGQNR